MHLNGFTVLNITVPEIDRQKGNVAILDVGSSIRCIVQGCPKAKYKWYKENTSDDTEGQILNVTDTMVRYLRIIQSLYCIITVGLFT